MGFLAVSGFNPWVLLALLGVIAFLLNRTRRRIARATSERRLQDHVGVSSPRAVDPHQFRSSTSAAEVRLHDLARELTARLDSKMVVLQQLIRDAEQQADRLEAALALASEHSPVKPHPAVSSLCPPQVSSSSPPAKPARNER